MLTHIDPSVSVRGTNNHDLAGTQADVISSKANIQSPDAHSRIKWGSVTRVIRERPARWEELRYNVVPLNRAPAPHDVMIARVNKIARHTAIELDSGWKASFYVGDLLAVAFGWRYATRQFHGEVPGLQSDYHLLSQGGVCGQVVSAPEGFGTPTVLKPIGYLADDTGCVVNLRNHGIVALSGVPRVPVIAVVGSSMDAGKTTMAANIIHGLAKAGCRVNAGKLTGTACVKDLNKMSDAGAQTVRDFTYAGFASTAMASVADLHDLCDIVMTNLSADHPDYVVLEIADGIVQRETQLVLDHLSDKGLVDHLCLAVHDAMAAPTCIDLLRRKWGLRVAAVSGVGTVSLLSTDELRSQVSEPCLMAEELCEPSVLDLFRTVSADK